MKSKAILYHSLFWAIIYFLWVLIFHNYSFSITKTITVEFCYLIFITVDFYAINNFIIPQLFFKKKYTFFVLATVIIITFSAWLRALVAMQMNQHVFHTTPINFKTLYLNSVVNISLWVLLVTIVKMLIDRIQTSSNWKCWKKKE